MVCRNNPLAYLIGYFKTVISLVGPRVDSERTGVGGTEWSTRRNGELRGQTVVDSGTSSHSDQSVKKGDQVLPQEIMD